MSDAMIGTSGGALFRLLGAGLLVASASCGDEFVVQRAPDFPKAGARVSVFGVFKDGRMSPESWDDLHARLAAVLGPTCETGYPDALTASGPGLAQAVDDYTRANGVTDDLLDRIAPMAKGDFILLVMMTGRPQTGPETQPVSTPSAPPASARGGGRRGFQGGGAPSRQPGREPSAFEVMGSVFSVQGHHAVGGVSMRYTGTSVDEGLTAFVKRLGGELPRVSCVGWASDARVDAAAIRKLESE